MSVAMTDGIPSAPSVTISPMRPRHVRAVLEIETTVYPKPWSRKTFEGELDRDRPYLIARVGPTVVGYAGLLMIADDGHVATVVVDPAWRGRQVATRLLLELVRQGIERGANQLTLEVRMSNTTAQGIYRRFGFVPAGARKAYYSDTGEDALIMWAHDVATDDYTERLAAIEVALPSGTHRHGFDVPVWSAASADATADPSAPPHPAAARQEAIGS